MEFKSAAKPSLYAYPPPMEEKKAEEREKVATAVLSIAARQKRRETVDKRDEEKMDVDKETVEKMDEEAEKVESEMFSGGKDEKTPAPVAEKDDKKKASKTKGDASASPAPGTSTSEETKEKEAPVKERKEPEPNFEILQNPARVMRQQLKVISIVDGQSYTPLKDVSIGGIIVTQRSGKPTDIVEALVEPIAACGPKNDDAKEPEAPEPFEYSDD